MIKIEGIQIHKIHLAFSPITKQFSLVGEDHAGDQIELSLSATAIQSLLRQIDDQSCETLIENLLD